MKKMKLFAITLIVLSSLVAIVFVAKAFGTSKMHHNQANGNGFAVLELFTSEGCSSCPPADTLLARIQQQYANKPVYVLAYHVDYWDRLGWKDVFSKAEFSKRQYQYSRQFTGQVYTPQLIINGHSEFVGADEASITNALTEELQGASATSLTLHAKQQNGSITVDYDAKGDVAGKQLLLALVQKHAVSKVARGENEGRTLHHAQIVRNLYTFNINPSKQGVQQLPLPADFNAGGWEIIGLLQDTQTGVITGAARASTVSASL